MKPESFQRAFKRALTTSIGKPLVGWNIGNPSVYGDWTKYHPWRAPGYAPVADPCGRAGGTKEYTSVGGETPIGAKKQFARGSLLPKLDVVTKLQSGVPIEVGWMVGSNHGGGYVYSLCPAGEPLTEECFQKTTLHFVGDFHVIRRLDNSSLPEPEYTMCMHLTRNLPQLVLYIPAWGSFLRVPVM